MKITATCICGSDLHFYNGFMPGMCPGALLLSCSYCCL